MPEFAPLEELARGALAEITDAETVGGFLGQVDETGGAVSLLFEAAMLGYPGWRWTVSIATVEGAEPTVLEAELMPGEGALLSPDWVPWSERLAEYEAAQGAAVFASSDAADDSSDDDDDDDDSDDDSDDDDDDDDDDFSTDVFRGGDFDGIDIEALDVPVNGVDEVSVDEAGSDEADGDEPGTDDDQDDERSY
jgi:hypothetical protein